MFPALVVAALCQVPPPTSAADIFAAPLIRQAPAVPTPAQRREAELEAMAPLAERLIQACQRIQELEARVEKLESELHAERTKAEEPPPRKTVRLYLQDRGVYVDGVPRADGGYDVVLDGRTLVVNPIPRN